MIKNKEELITESNKWGLLAIDEVKTLVENLMESNDMEVEELADFLGWKPKKVQACLDGEGDLRISDLATLLIANDLVLEIKPASQTDISYGEPEEEEDDEDEFHARVSFPGLSSFIPVHDFVEPSIQGGYHRIVAEHRAGKPRFPLRQHRLHPAYFPDFRNARKVLFHRDIDFICEVTKNNGIRK